MKDRITLVAALFMLSACCLSNGSALEPALEFTYGSPYENWAGSRRDNCDVHVQNGLHLPHRSRPFVIHFVWWLGWCQADQ